MWSIYEEVESTLVTVHLQSTLEHIEARLSLIMEAGMCTPNSLINCLLEFPYFPIRWYENL